MSANAAVVPRPTSVTVAVAIGWISVALDVVGGISLLILSGNDDVKSALDADSSTIVTAGIVSLVFAAVLAAVVYQLSKGSSVARMLVTIVMVVRIVFSVWVLVAFGTHQLGEALAALAVAIAALALLWNEKASAFFAANRT